MLLQLVEPGQTPEPHAGDRKVALGIDLGTTHSVAAVVVEGQPRALFLEGGGSSLLPSVVSYENVCVVGRDAVAKNHALGSIKRLMGRGFEDNIVSQFPQAIPGQGQAVCLSVPGRDPVSPIEVSADILRYIKTRAEDLLDETVDHAVITVPAHFDDAARAATKDAARLAGLNVLRLINEPTAAALAYGLETGAEGVYAIYDLGGGTFDLSLLKLDKGVFQVLATGGDLTLGGDDVDAALCEILKVASTPENRKALKAAKEALSESVEVQVDVGGESYTITPETLESAAGPLVERTLAICSSVLRDAQLKVEDIQGVVLVGGSTRLKSVLQSVELFFEKPPRVDIHPDEAVAMGAALQAHGLIDGSDTLLLDVIPLSLGLETMGGIVEKILHRNTPIPAMANQEFTTYQDGQTGLVVHVVQGEREFVDDCRSLARFELSGIPPLPAGAARIDIQFHVDADGLLTVSAKELTTGLSQHIEVKPSYGLTPGEMEKMLEAGLKHGQKDMENRLLQESRVEGERLIHDVNRALEDDGDLLSPAEKTLLLQCIEDLTIGLKSASRDEIQRCHDALDKATQSFANKRVFRQII